jgi:hypothetical protein
MCTRTSILLLKAKFSPMFLLEKGQNGVKSEIKIRPRLVNED